jgi:magnesium transporter
VPTQIFAVREGAKTRLLKPHPKEVLKLLAEKGTYVWVCMDAEGEEERDLLEEVFKIHPLLIEDAFNQAQSPKIEEHGDYLYIILHGLTEKACAQGRVETADIDIILGANYLVTHYHSDISSVVRVQAAIEKDPSILAKGPAVVAHRLVDHMIDQYFPLMEHLDATISALEETIIHKPDADPLERILDLKRDLQRIRRVGIYQRDILHRLSRGDFDLIPKSVLPFLRDVYDHFVRVTDETESYRETVNSSLEAYRSMQAHRMNEVMKLLTLISTVVLPLNFVTGLYGMNFDYMPGLHWKFGYATAWLVMITTVTSFFVFFRKRNWI